MKNVIVIACTVIVASTIARPHAARGDRITPPAVPLDIEVPAGHKPFLVAHAVGTQGYFCVPSGSGVVWLPFGPQATLFNEDLEQTLTHFLSMNPFEAFPPRATWQDSRDTSAVWAGQPVSSSDPNYVAPGAIPWLRLTVVGAQQGPKGGDRLTPTTYIHRVNTVGGRAPTTGCTDQERRALVPYEADYYFYRAAGNQP